VTKIARLLKCARAGLFVLFAIGLVIGCSGVEVTRYYKQGAVATGSPIATRVGRQVLERGGNAFDAAVAVGFALAVVHPEAGNVGGGGFAVVREGRTGKIQALDFRETAPSAATTDMYLDSAGNVVDSLSTYGALAVGVPGSVAGMYELWKTHGSMPWDELVGYGAGLADTGFLVDEYLATSLKDYRKHLTGFAETAKVFFPNGEAFKAGDRFAQSDLAATLYLIATDGPAGFYDGPVADKIVAAMQANGGLIAKADLESYQAVWREPIHFTFDSLDVYSMSPPSSGGIIIGEILGLLEPYDFSRMTPGSPEYIHLFTECARLAYADRSVHLGDPSFWDNPTELLNEKYLAERRDKIKLDHATTSAQVGPGNPYAYESNSTTHYSICDGAGNMVAVTTTLNTNYGSKLVVGGAGFLLNNEMDDFSAKPGFPNTYGLIGAEANKIEPGKRMLSSMSPTLILKDGNPFMVLGSPGGSKIITSVAETIVNLTRFHLSPGETVTYPRFHHQWLPDTLYLEKDGFDNSVEERLESYGHALKEIAPFCDVQLIYIDPSGQMTAASDPRRNGAADGY